MNYDIEVKFEELYEFIISLHTYLCRKSHKKIDLTSVWAEEIRGRIIPPAASRFDEAEINGDWKITYLIILLCPVPERADLFLNWLEGLSTGDLYELLDGYINQFPENMTAYRSKLLYLFSDWYELYFRHLDGTVTAALREEAARQKALLALQPGETFVEDATNGLIFRPVPGQEKLLLIPQYHFQPLNVIYHYGRLTLCHYNARIYPEKGEGLSPHDMRIIRCLGEASRLKILRFLHEKPRTYSEIVRHLKLSKGITHDHISKLRSAGLIYGYLEGETLTEYGLRVKNLSYVQEQIRHYIEKEG